MKNESVSAFYRRGQPTTTVFLIDTFLHSRKNKAPCPEALLIL
jgi:hypothetical protein